MSLKKNPLKLNKLQLKTLTLFQKLAQYPDVAEDLGNGEKKLMQLPAPHGNHFHLGDKVVMSKDATGLQNEAVWIALERKGLIRVEMPFNIVLTQEGLSYNTDPWPQTILHGSDH